MSLCTKCQSEDHQSAQLTISISWHVDDVREVAPNLDDKQAYQVLLLCKKNHDATLGITWETLECHSEILFPGSTKTEELKVA